MCSIYNLSLDVDRASRQRPAMSIGERIRQGRRGAGQSQAWLAEKVGQAQTTISSWETGRTEPSREDVARIAKALNVEVGVLELGDQAQGARPRGYPHIGKVGA